MGRRIHELPSWPRLYRDHESLTAPLAEARYVQGRLIGQIEALGSSLQNEAVLRTLTDDAVKSGEIEGETLDADQVRSSVARRLGMNVEAPEAADPHVEGVVEMVIDATQRHDDPLTQERLFGWHAALIPTGRSGMYRVTMPSRVEAPAVARLADEMRWFLDWFNTDTTEPVLKAAIAHLWFVTIHPFDDGNGRIARAIADMALARSENSPRRFYSMSAQFREERDDYYRILEEAQRGTLDVTPWMQWFLACLTRAIDGAQITLSGVLTKARHWDKLRDVPLNERQRLVIHRLLEGLEGKLTTSKWATLTESSQDTALRDIQQLVEHGVLVRDAAGGRSTNYALRTTP